MDNRLRLLARSFAVFVSVLATLIGATGATLDVGDPAPPIHTGDWLQGDPVSRFAEGTGYLVEFWASWSASSRDSVPQLNEISQKFKNNGLTVIGQNCWEQDKSAATSFIKELKITYPVALDDESRSMARNWMSAAGRSSLPTAFLIDKKGKVAWIGNSAELSEQIITDLLAGKLKLEPRPAPESLPQKDPLAQQEERYSNIIAQGSSNSIETASALVQRARVRARTGQWKEASADLKQAYQINPSDHWSWYLLTPLLIQIGDFAAYQKISHETLIRFGQEDDTMIAGRAAEGCLLLPGATTNDLELAAQIVPRKVYQHWRRFYIGLVEYRLGHFDSAADWMEKIRTDPGGSINGVDRWACEADARFILAMAWHQLKEPQKSRGAFSQAKEIIDNVLPKFDGPDLGNNWWNILTTHILAKEATELIQKSEAASPGSQ
jgi:tetratricopeptide (TPR) repeat protein